MITGLLIPQDAAKPLREEPIEALADYQRLVGGYVQLVHAELERLTLVLNEDGKVRGMPINRRATSMWWLLSPAVRRTDVLVGDVIVVGAKGGYRTMTNLPDQFRLLLLETPIYKIEARVGERGGRWEMRPEEFSNYFDCAVAAVNLVKLSRDVREVRVASA